MITRHACSRRALLAFTGLLAFGLVVATAAGAAEITDDNVAEKIAEAKTKADHDALAAYFREEAAQAASKVALHEKMEKHLAGVGKSRVNTVGHCRTLIRSGRDEKAAYEALAEEQSQLARKAGQ